MSAVVKIRRGSLPGMQVCGTSDADSAQARIDPFPPAGFDQAVLARVRTFAIEGVDPIPVAAEVDVRTGLPSFSIVGLGDAAVRESKERVRAAIQNSGFEFPMRRITANLAPASIRKSGPGFDVALAIAILVASGQLPPLAMDGAAVFGELSLGGAIRTCRGTLNAAEGARQDGLDRVYVPEGAAGEAAAVDQLEICPVRDLGELHAVLVGSRAVRRAEPAPWPPPRSGTEPTLDLADVCGQPAAVEALTVAAAGGHNILLEGPPGTGKTMLARRLPGLLPPPSREEAVEITRIQSAVGLLQCDGLTASRPFRAPHHTVSTAGLIGGGSLPMPGEVTLAHRGVLFLDEIPEFRRDALEALRQPLEDGCVSIVRRAGRSEFPARFQLVASANPCPCGHCGDSERCSCSPAALASYARRLSGPLLDRFDLSTEVARPRADELARGNGRILSGEARDRVAAARAVQDERWGEGGLNAFASIEALDRHGIAAAAHAVAAEAYEAGRISPRGRARVLRTARTIADLREFEQIEPEHVLAALSMRTRTRSC